MTMDQVNELDGLIAQAGALDGDAAATSPAAIMEQQAQAEAMGLSDQNSQAVGMMLGLAVPILSRLYPSLEQVYTPETCGALSASLGPVLAKYGVNLTEWGGAYKEEIGALFVCGPVAWATVQGIKADIAARAGAPAAVPVAGPATLNPAPPATGPRPGDFAYREPVEA